MRRSTLHQRRSNARASLTSRHVSTFREHSRSAITARVVLLGVVVALVALFVTKATNHQIQSGTFQGTVASPQVHVVVNLGNASLHPRQLVFDHARNGLWFWTSVITGKGTTYDNRLYFYDLAQNQMRSWPLYSGDWSSQLLSGLAVAPNGEVWIGWNHNLVRFDPLSQTSIRYVLPAHTQYPLPAAAIGNLPADLGIADLVVAQDGAIWIARYAALSLTAFTPATASFSEYPLPSDSGDPAKLAITSNGHIMFTTDLAAMHPGYSAVMAGDFDVHSHVAILTTQTGRSLTATPQGDTYVAVGHGMGLARLPSAVRFTAEKQQGAMALQQHVLPFDVDDTSVTTDAQGRIWVAVAGQPDLARFDPTSGAIQEFQYAAPSIAAHPIQDRPLDVQPVTPAPGAVWLTNIVAMACDSEGNLWYIRAGSDQIEEVTP